MSPNPDMGTWTLANLGSIQKLCRCKKQHGNRAIQGFVGIASHSMVLDSLHQHGTGYLKQTSTSIGTYVAPYKQ